MHAGGACPLPLFPGQLMQRMSTCIPILCVRVQASLDPRVSPCPRQALCIPGCPRQPRAGAGIITERGKMLPGGRSYSTTSSCNKKRNIWYWSVDLYIHMALCFNKKWGGGYGAGHERHTELEKLRNMKLLFWCLRN